MVFDKAFLLEIAGSWQLLKQAEALQIGGAVLLVTGNAPILRGEVQSEGILYTAELNVKSTILPYSSCSCGKKGTGRTCLHVLALCFEYQKQQALLKQQQVAESSPKADIHHQPSLQHLKCSQGKGKSLSFRIYLPPNTLQAIEQDAIVVRFEALIDHQPPVTLESLDRGKAYALDPVHLKIAHLVEDWCYGKYYSLLQLSRSRLLRLLEIPDGASVFYDSALKTPLAGEVVMGYQKACAARETLMAYKVIPHASKKAVITETAVSIIQPFEIEGSLKYLVCRLPSKNHHYYQQISLLIKNEGFQLDPSTKRWWLRDAHKVLNFLAQYSTVMLKEWEAVCSEALLKALESAVFIQNHIVAEAVGDEYALKITLKAEGLEESILREALAQGKYYIEVGGQVYLINPKHIEQCIQAQAALDERPLNFCLPSYEKQVCRSALVDIENILNESDLSFTPPEEWKIKTDALRSMAALQPAPIRSDLNDRLRGYQQMGVAWLWHLYQNGLAGILADEMGLGKTIQALSLMEVIKHYGGDAAPMLVIAPAGLVENWRREAQVFTPELRVFVHHREGRLEGVEVFEHYDLIITSYSTLTRDIELFQSIHFKVIIGDEAQHVKNRLTRNAKALRLLKARARFLLTGTPLENSLDDLRALFDFLLPGYLTRMPPALKADERVWYHDRLKQQAAPYILRRSKAQVLPELPDKIEQVIYCALEPQQSALYQAIYQKTEAELARLEYAGAAQGQIHLAVLQQILRLRQTCVDPRLIDAKASPEDSAKLRVLKELLAEIMDDGHRVLIFSQFVEALQLIAEALEALNINYAYIDGKTKDRVAVCERFNQDLSLSVCLISLKAGGVGLNLTGADTVIHYDPWWNPAVEAQATDRAHRMGQKKTVTSIKLIVADTIEEKVLALQKMKSHLLKDLFEASEEANAKIGFDTLLSLLKPDTDA